MDKIQRNFNVKYTQRHTRRLLHQLGYSRVKPRPIHFKKDSEKAKGQAHRLKKNSPIWIKAGQFSQKMNVV